MLRVVLMILLAIGTQDIEDHNHYYDEDFYMCGCVLELDLDDGYDIYYLEDDGGF